MEERRKNIDDLFREGLENHRETPGAEVWASLEQRLTGGNAAVAQPPSRKWLWYLVLLVLLAVVTYFAVRKASENASDKHLLNEHIDGAPAPAPALSNTAENTADKKPGKDFTTDTTGNSAGGNSLSGQAGIAGKAKKQDQQQLASPNLQPAAPGKADGKKALSFNAAKLATTQKPPVLAPSAVISGQVPVQSGMVTSVPSSGKTKKNAAAKKPAGNGTSKSMTASVNGTPPNANAPGKMTNSPVDKNEPTNKNEPVNPGFGSVKKNNTSGTQENETANPSSASLASGTPDLTSTQKSNTKPSGAPSKKTGSKGKPGVKNNPPPNPTGNQTATVSKQDAAPVPAKTKKTNGKSANNSAGLQSVSGNTTAPSSPTAGNAASGNDAPSTPDGQQETSGTGEKVKAVPATAQNKTGSIKKKASSGSANNAATEDEDMPVVAGNSPVRTKKTKSSSPAPAAKAPGKTMAGTPESAPSAAAGPGTSAKKPVKPAVKSSATTVPKTAAVPKKKPVSALSSAGKPINVNGTPSGKKPLKTSPATFADKNLPPVIADTFGKKELTDKAVHFNDHPGQSNAEETFVKKETTTAPQTVKSTAGTSGQPANPARKSKIRVNSNAEEVGGEGVSPENSYAAKPPKQPFEKTSEGYRINTGQDEGATDNNNKAEADQTGGEAAAPAPPAGGGGGGGGSEPNSPLRNFGKKFSFEGGIKVGYDRGIEQNTSGSIVIAPVLQWNISPRVAVSLQPGLKYNQLSKTALSDAQAYHRIISAIRDSAHVVINDSIPPANDSIQRNYIYRNTYDSISIGSKLDPKNYWELELPLLLSYKVSSNLSIFAGPMLTFGNIIRINEDRKEFNGLQRLDTLSYAPVSVDTNNNSNYPNPPGILNYFSYNTPDISTAPVSTDQNPSSNPARFGIMLGFSYELKRRWTIDVLVRKTLSDMRYIPNEQVRKIYTQPYFRIMIGYKLFNPGSKNDFTDRSGL